MNKPPLSELQGLGNFTATLLNERTPRALVIVGAARLEEELKTIVALAAPGFEAECRAHSFRIDLLVSMGLLPGEVASSLKKIAKIRNYFAHVSSVVSINDSEISGEVAALFGVLEKAIGVATLSQSMFQNVIAKIPRGRPPSTWADEVYEKYQTSIVLLLWYLVILRHNLPPRPSPLPLKKEGYW